MQYYYTDCVLCCDACPVCNIVIYTLVLALVLTNDDNLATATF